MALPSIIQRLYYVRTEIFATIVASYMSSEFWWGEYLKVMSSGDVLNVFTQSR